MTNKYNVNELTKIELQRHVGNALNFIKNEYGSEDYKKYYISTSKSIPQLLRGWLIDNFPLDYYAGRLGKGIIYGHKINRGIKN